VEPPRRPGEVHSQVWDLFPNAAFVLTAVLFQAIPKGFFPIQDTGVIQGVSEAAQTVSFAEMSRLQRSLTSVILKDPAVDSLSSFIGIDGTNTTLNSGRVLINLKPLNQRTGSASDVIRRLQPELEQVAGITLFMQPVQDLTVEDRVSRTQFQYTLEDPNADELNTFAPKMVAKLKELPELTDVATEQQVQGLRASVVFDRDTAARVGITPASIDQTLYDAYGQREVSTMFTQLNQYHVVLEVKPGFDMNPSSLGELFIRAGAVAAGAPSIQSSTAFPNGGQIPLNTFSHVVMTTVPITVNHQGQFPVVTLSFNLAPNVSLGDAVKAVNQVKDGMGMPPSIQAAYQGTAQAFQSSLANEPVLIAAALITVYLVLGVLYESYIHPLTILSALPSAGVGALVALILALGPVSGAHFNPVVTLADRVFGGISTADAAGYIAAQVADPRDLVGPRPMSDSDAARRNAVLDNYGKGKVTASDKTSDQSGKVSDIAQ